MAFNLDIDSLGEDTEKEEKKPSNPKNEEKKREKKPVDPDAEEKRKEKKDLVVVKLKEEIEELKKLQSGLEKRLSEYVSKTYLESRLVSQNKDLPMLESNKSEFIHRLQSCLDRLKSRHAREIANNPNCAAATDINFVQKQLDEWKQIIH